MDDSMNSNRSTSAMDISPASSPVDFRSPNHHLMNAFQQQQELLANILFNEPSIVEYRSTNRIAAPSFYEPDFNESRNFYLSSTALSDVNMDIKSDNNVEEKYQLRQRTVPQSIPSIAEEAPAVKQPKSKPYRKLLFSMLPLTVIIILILRSVVHHSEISVVATRTVDWQNASEYLTKNLIGQDRGLEEFKDVMSKHKNYTIVIIEGPIGTGKSYLAASLEKFIPTALLSANTLLGLSSHHWTESDRLSSYLLSHLHAALFQILIIDDFDLLSKNSTYCQTLTTAVNSMKDNNDVFLLLLHTGKISDVCKQNLERIMTRFIQFRMLQRHHVRACIENEAYVQNVQPPLNSKQIENILDSLKYTNENGDLYCTTGCKQIPSLVMLESRKRV